MNIIQLLHPKALIDYIYDDTTCRQALEMNHPTYTFVKNTIAAIASEHSKKDLIQQNNARNKNAYVMGSDAYELDHLLSKSSDLAKNSSKDGDRK